MTMKKYYLVYKTTNLVNGKIYIGKHETDNLDDGTKVEVKDMYAFCEYCENKW